MNFNTFYFEHRAFIEERWLPIYVEVMLEEDPEKKISIIRKAQKKAAKEIHDIEVKSTFIAYLEEQINWPSSTSQTAQSNETLNTGKQTIEGIKSDSKKIQWTGTREELRSLFDLLYGSGLLAEGSDIPTLAQNHFYISGNKPIDNKSFAKVKRLKKDVSKETTEQFLEFLREQEELK